MSVRRKKTAPLTEKQKAFVEANHALIGTPAIRRRACRNLSGDDKNQEASAALIKAAKKFKKSKGVKFSTYAVATIKNELWRCDGEYSLIRIPACARRNGVGGERLRKFADAARDCVNLGALTENGWDAAAPEDEESEFGYRAMRAVSWAVRKLPPMERNVIRAVVFRGETATRVGRTHGLTYGQVVKLKLQAFARLRASLAKHV